MSGFTVLDVSGSQVTPTLIPMKETGEFVYEGRVWRPVPALPE